MELKDVLPSGHPGCVWKPQGQDQARIWRAPETPQGQRAWTLSLGVPLASYSGGVPGAGKVRALLRGHQKQRLGQGRDVPSAKLPTEYFPLSSFGTEGGGSHPRSLSCQACSGLIVQGHGM